jgi:uncharacterized membrane protein
LQPPRLQSDAPAPLASGLVEIWSAGAAYAISFVNIYILWVAHHELMRHHDPPRHAISLSERRFIIGDRRDAIFHFSLAEHISAADASLAAAIYSGALLWVALFYNLVCAI